MKIAICSDLHLEFGDLVLPEGEADVLVLSRDILIARLISVLHTVDLTSWLAEKPFNQAVHDRAMDMRNFLVSCVNRFDNVVMVAGNHEHYNGDFNTTAEILYEEARRVNALSTKGTLHYMENNNTVIGGVTFIGSTLWTDMNKGDPVTIFTSGRNMNDYRSVTNGKVRLHPEDTMEAHKFSLAYIAQAVAASKISGLPVVVCTHHSPSRLSTHPRYTGNDMNGAYSSDLTEFILDNPNIKLWTHGHTHDPYDYKVGETRIICNPRGYIGHEDIANDFNLKIVTI